MRLSLTPPQKRLLLLGAGNAHLPFLRSLAMKPLSEASILLVTETLFPWYSAMIPGFLQGDFAEEDLRIDVLKLASAAGIEVIESSVEAIEAGERRVKLSEERYVSYDLLSINLGGLCAPIDTSRATIPVIPMRPLHRMFPGLLKAYAAPGSKRPFRLKIVGGGASGCELACALAQASAFPEMDITLVHRGDRLVGEVPVRASEIVEKELSDLGVHVICGAEVVSVTENKLVTLLGRSLEADAVLWAVAPLGPAALKDSGLALSEDGRLLVGPTLASVSHPHVFAGGDAAVVQGHARLARNGVIAVRQGKTLVRNLRSTITNDKLEDFRTSGSGLSLLRLRRGQGLCVFGNLVARGTWVRRWKDHIDRKWIEKFVVAGVPANSPEKFHCGGCGSKVSAQVLEETLKALPGYRSESVIVGREQGEDASVHLPPAGQVEVQSVDFFKSFLPDLFLTGRIAALHALNDIYAMGAAPYSALAIVTLPEAAPGVQSSRLHTLLAGALTTLTENRVTLLGGHTTETADTSIGLSVTGYAPPERFFRKSEIKEGDALILTKPIGSGALLAALMRGFLSASDYGSLVSGLLQSNEKAAQIFREAGVRACTDISGFGLIGHLREMLRDEKLGAVLFEGAIRKYPGFETIVAAGVLSTAHEKNESLRSQLEIETTSSLAWAFDPQTSGGLLAAVPAPLAEKVLEWLELYDYRASIVGSITKREAKAIRIRTGFWTSSPQRQTSNSKSVSPP